jgi:hypothetical protein
MNALEAREEGDSLTAEGKPLIEAGSVGNVLAVLRAQHVEGRKAGAAESLVAHRLIVNSLWMNRHTLGTNW